MASSLLIDDNPLQVLPKLAEKIGLNEAIVLQQLHYWLNKSDNRRDGVKWVYNSYTGWKEQFPFWGIRTIQRTFLRLENLGLIQIGNFNKMKGDLTKWYTIDYAGVDALEQSSLLRLRDTPSCQIGTMPSRQNGTTIVPEWHDHSANMTRPLPETTTETTTENTTTPLPPKVRPIQKPLVVDDEKAKALKVLRALIARPNEQFINGGTNAFMHDLADNNSGEWVNAACELAAGKNASLTYVKAILDHWQRHGFKCECRSPKSTEPIPIQQKQQRAQQPYMSEYGVPYADITHAVNYPKNGTFGKDFIFVAKGS